MTLMRYWAMGCAMVGVSLIAPALHELTTERVRHELAVAEPTPAPQPAGSPAGFGGLALDGSGRVQ